MASRLGRPRALLKDRRNIRRMALDISRAGDPTGSFFVSSVAAQGSAGEEHGRRAVAPASPWASALSRQASAAHPLGAGPGYFP
jgi:hypothetical protein